MLLSIVSLYLPTSRLAILLFENKKAATAFLTSPLQKKYAVRIDQKRFLGLLFKIIFTSTANGAGPVFRKIFKGGSSGNTPFVVTYCRIIHITANLADPLVHSILLFHLILRLVAPGNPFENPTIQDNLQFLFIIRNHHFTFVICHLAFSI
jgi:hypothetical protein